MAEDLLIKSVVRGHEASFDGGDDKLAHVKEEKQDAAVLKTESTDAILTKKTLSRPPKGDETLTTLNCRWDGWSKRLRLQPRHENMTETTVESTA